MKKAFRKAIAVIASAAIAVSMLPVQTFALNIPSDGVMAVPADEIEAVNRFTTDAVSAGESIYYDGVIPAFSYIVSGGNVTVTRIYRNLVTLSVPSRINGYDVTAIASYAAENDSAGGTGLIYLNLPDTVTSIGKYAFFGNRLRSFEAPSGLKTIGDAAFYGNDISDVRLNEGLTTIGASAFNSNPVSSVEFPSTLKTLGSEAFRYGSAASKSVSLVTASFFGSSTQIGSNAIPSTADVYGYSGTTAEKYANKNGRYFHSFGAFPYLGSISGLRSSDKTANTITLVWDGCSNSKYLSGYAVYVYRSGEWVQIATTTANAKSYTVKGLAKGTKYKFGVRGYQKQPYDLSKMKSITTSTKSSGSSSSSGGSTSSLKAPTLKASAGDRSVKLTWSKVSGADKYYIERYNGFYERWDVIGSTSSTSYTDSGLTNGTTYRYRVYASKNGKAGRTSSTVTAVPDAGQNVNFNVSAKVSGSSVVLSWNGVKGATKYRVLRYNPTRDTWDKITDTSAKTYTDKSVAAGKTYYYKISAYKNSTLIKTTEKINVTVTAQALSAPRLSAKVSGNSVILSWTSVAAAKQYRIQRYDAYTDRWDVIVETTNLSFVDYNVIAGRTYYYRAFSYDGKNYSSASSTVTVKMTGGEDVTRLAAPVLSGTVSGQNVVLSWTSVSRATGYRIERRIAGGSWQFLADSSSVSYTDSALAGNTTYEYRVYAYRGSVFSGASNTVTLSVGGMNVNPIIMF